MDVKATFLNGVVEEEVYVEQPLSFETHDGESHVCRLKKALYGLKQTPRTWYGRIDSSLSSLGFTKSKADSNLYYKIEEGNPVILLFGYTGYSQNNEHLEKPLHTNRSQINTPMFVTWLKPSRGK